MYFGNPAGYYALLGVLALIIIYLIRPRPKDMTLPSLMFFLKDTGLAKKKSFLEKLLRNLIFLLQLIAIAGLAFSIMQPSIKSSYDTTAENTVIVLDVSASMQADGRFSEAVNIAEDSLKGDVSIILAEETPLVVLDRGSRSKAKSLLDSVKAKDIGTNIGDAMLMAKDILNGQEGRVLVLSDFMQTQGPDPNVVRKILEAEKAVVDFVDVSGKPDKGNFGIIDLSIEKHNTLIYIKNYNKESRAITVSVINGNKEIKKMSKTFLADSVETINFETQPGITEIRIEDSDDLDADNKAYISAPDKIDISVLLITNNVNSFLKYALESSKDITLKIAEPPILPKTQDFDVVIMSNVDKSKLLTGTINEIKKNVESGKHFIVAAQDTMQQIDFLDTLPVYLMEKKEKENVKIYSYSDSDEDKYDFAGESSIDYGTTLKYFTATAKNGSVIYAMAGDSPIIASMKIGAGNVVYYGIFDDSSSFKASPSYPVFWNELINSLMNTDDISKFNYKTGKILSTNTQMDVKTPQGTIKANIIIMDKEGIYEVGSLKIAANLLNEKESDIYQATNIQTMKHDSYKAGKVQREKETNLEMYLLALVVLSLLAEMAYVKYIGDL
ncbi:hypothetical protein COV19_06075 [Candidatus Woesearchaeota archaeon CG10_big_fil_rev_8_21_14_0_10_44_13]|nr:MAG: hypothetical protein COV19_06075 [Candidatus Woesearchaeota archaeon CG10_big_fil_rev_8_21_14_0_10_44_13]